MPFRISLISAEQQKRIIIIQAIQIIQQEEVGTSRVKAFFILTSFSILN